VKNADIEAFKKKINLKGYRVPLIKQSEKCTLFLSFESDL